MQSQNAKCWFTCSSIWLTYLCPPNDLSICLVLWAMKYLHACYRLHWFAINRAYNTVKGREKAKFQLSKKHELNREHCKRELRQDQRAAPLLHLNPPAASLQVFSELSILQFELLQHSDLPHQLHGAQTKISLRREPKGFSQGAKTNDLECQLLIVTMVLGLQLHREQQPFWNGLLRGWAGRKSQEAACSLLALQLPPLTPALVNRHKPGAGSRFFNKASHQSWDLVRC